MLLTASDTVKMFIVFLVLQSSVFPVLFGEFFRSLCSVDPLGTADSQPRH